MSMFDSISERLTGHLLLGVVEPNKGLLYEALNFNVQYLDDLHIDKLSKYILVLGQYLVSVKYAENSASASYIDSSNSLEFLLFRNKAKAIDESGCKTEKDKRLWLLLNITEISALHEKLIALEIEKTFLSDMYRAVEGLLNAYKKEHSRRTQEIYQP